MSAVLDKLLTITTSTTPPAISAIAFASPGPVGAITLAMNAPAQNEAEQETDTGEIEDVSGVVTAVDATAKTFTIKADNNSAGLTFVTDATATTFSDGLTALGDLKAGMVVKVEGTTKADGTLFAKEVEGLETTTTGLAADGLIVTRTPGLNGGIPFNATSLQIVVHDASSAAAATSQPATGSLITVNIDANTKFVIDFGSGKTKIADPALAFSALNIDVGQKVEVDVDTAAADNLTARRIVLKKQALVGTVSNFSASGFTLTLDSDNLMGILFPITVKTTSTTLVKGTVADGAKVRVRGLLFTNNKNYTLAAGRIDLVP